MTSKDRKYSSKEYSTKNRYSENENNDKIQKKSSSKHRREKAGDGNVELEYKHKIDNSKEDEEENEKRVKEEKNRRRRVNDEVVKKENESDKKRRHHSEKVEETNEEKRHPRRTNEDEYVERRKGKGEHKTEIGRTRDEEHNEERRRRRKGEYDEDNGERRRKRTEDKEEYEKGRHGTGKGEESNEMRKHRRRENEENNEKRKTKESKEESETVKQRNDRREGQKIRENEISQDRNERRHRSKKVESEDGEDNHKKKRSKEKENKAFLDVVDEPVAFKVRSDGDREYEQKRRGHRESNSKEHKDEGYKESNESKSYQKSNVPIAASEELDYEDDFDNYDEDDFENELLEKSPVGNEPTASDQSSGISQVSKESEKTSLPPTRDEISKPTTKIGKTNSSFINFKISQKKYSHDLVANRMLSRAYDLSRLIEMDKVEYDILEIAPVVEHSQYMKLFGKEGCQHEGSQTGSDNMARESQTEVIEERVVWTQCPPLDDNEYFQVVSDSMEPSASMAKKYNNEYSFTNDKMDNSYISVLMIPTLTMIENILEEETTCEIAVKVSGSHDNNDDNKQTISSGYSKYSIADGLDCLIARFAVSNSNMFVTVHQLSKAATEKDQSKLFSPISVWKLSGNIGEPHMCLSCPGISETQTSISCVTFSPDAAASHIICGLSTGTLALWDLTDGKTNRKCLYPAYLTSVLSEDSDLCHKGPIIGLQPINNELNSTNSYQLISLDSWAQLVIWMVSIVNQQQRNQWNLESGSLIDLNLRPGAKYRMSRVTSSCLLSNSYMTSMTLDPSCNTHLFCGTNSGQIIQHTRTNQTTSDNNRSTAHHKTLGKTDQYESGAITQLDFYPFFEPYLLAGHDDGLIEIFAVGKSQSLLSFHYKHQVPILQLKWSRSHPAIFISFDVEGNLCVWNVLLDLYRPVHVQKLPGYIGFDLSSDSKWQTVRKETIHSRARLLLWALDGRVEVHELADAFSNPDLDVTFKTCSLFQSLI